MTDASKRTTGGELREDGGIPIPFDVELVDTIAHFARLEDGRERGAPCANCGKPVEVGQVVLAWEDAGEMHADCTNPFSLESDRGENEPEPCILLGSPMIRHRIAALNPIPPAETVIAEGMVERAADAMRAWTSGEPDIRGRHSVHERQKPVAYFADNEAAQREVKIRNARSALLAAYTPSRADQEGELKQ